MEVWNKGERSGIRVYGCGIRLWEGALSVRSVGRGLGSFNLLNKSLFYKFVTHFGKINMLHGSPLLDIWITHPLNGVSPSRATLKTTYK